MFKYLVDILLNMGVERADVLERLAGELGVKPDEVSRTLGEIERESPRILESKFRGILESILEVGQEGNSNYCVLLVKNHDKEYKPRYEGLILSDSIGHNVEVKWNIQEKRIQIHDLKSKRWYR